jgi:probable HAF family extracellular repeat protein
LKHLVLGLSVAGLTASCQDDPLEPTRGHRVEDGPDIQLAEIQSGGALASSGPSNLGSLGGTETYAQGINNLSQVAGYGVTPAGRRGFVWEDGVLTTLPAQAGSQGTHAEALDLNDAGQIVGYSTYPGNQGNSQSALWTRDATGAWTLTLLGSLGGIASRATAINRAGQIVGFSTRAENLRFHAFLWTPASGIEDIAQAMSQVYPFDTYAYDINDNAQVVGYGYEASRTFFHAFLYDHSTGQVRDLGTLPGGRNSYATGINNVGQIVGYADASNGETHAFVWTSSGGMTDLGALPGSQGTLSEAQAISDNGQVVGRSTYPAGQGNTHAFVWQQDGTGTWSMTDLGALGNGIAAGATAVNNLDQAVGYSTDATTNNSAFYATLWPLATNQPPVANPGGPYAENPGVEITFDAGRSTDPEGASLTYAWDFGDGSPVQPTSSPDATHAYAAYGTYTLALTVTDPLGARDTKTTTAAITGLDAMTPACGHAVTGIAFDGSSYYLAEGHNGLNQCITRYSADRGVRRDHQVFPVDTRGLHFVPATGKLVARTWGGALFEIDYADRSVRQLTSYNVTADLPANEQNQPAADPDGTTYWRLNPTTSNAERRQLSDNALLKTIPVAGAVGEPAVAVSNEWLFIRTSDGVNAYAKATGAPAGSHPTREPAACSGFGLGTSAAGDRIMYDATCTRVHAEPITVTPPENRPPVADPGGAYAGAEGDLITFDGGHSTDPDGDSLVAYAWDFGDGFTSTEVRPAHAYADNGTFTVSLTVTDTRGASGTGTSTATISNVPPRGTFNAPTTALENTKLFLSIGAVNESGSADVIEYAFDCGDGRGYGLWTATNNRPCTPADNGTFTVRGKIRDDDGGENEYTATIAVENAAPTATFSVNSPVNEGSFYGIILSKPSDAPGDASTLRFAFDCGSGTGYGAFGSTLTMNCPGPDGPRLYAVRAKIIDKDGGSTEYAGSASILNVAPSVQGLQILSQSSIGKKPGPDVTIGFNFTDQGNDDAVTTAGWAYTITWGDGTTTTGNDFPGRVISQDHRYPQPGRYSVMVEVRDKDGGVGTSRNALAVRVG